MYVKLGGGILLIRLPAMRRIWLVCASFWKTISGYYMQGFDGFFFRVSDSTTVVVLTYIGNYVSILVGLQVLHVFWRVVEHWHAASGMDCNVAICRDVAEGHQLVD